MPSPSETDPTHLSEDIADLFAIYKNLRRVLVELTAAGPLMETRHTASKKLDNGERVSHQEATRVSEQIRTLFKLRAILIDAGLPLEFPGEQPARAPRATKSITKPAAEQPAPPAELFPAPQNPAPFNPTLKSTRPPDYDRPFIPRDLLRGRSASATGS